MDYLVRIIIYVNAKVTFPQQTIFEKKVKHDRHKERELFEKSTEEKLEIIEKFKILGNE